MGNVLNEFINGIHITEDELERRLGCGRSVLQSLHNQLIDKHSSVWLDQGDSLEAPPEISVWLAPAQIGSMSRALRDLASGTDIEAWEFPIRLSQEPKDALRLAAELDDAIGSLPD